MPQAIAHGASGYASAHYHPIETIICTHFGPRWWALVMCGEWITARVDSMGYAIMRRRKENED